MVRPGPVLSKPSMMYVVGPACDATTGCLLVHGLKGKLGTWGVLCTTQCTRCSLLQCIAVGTVNGKLYSGQVCGQPAAKCSGPETWSSQFADGNLKQGRHPLFRPPWSCHHLQEDPLGLVVPPQSGTGTMQPVPPGVLLQAAEAEEGCC